MQVDDLDELITYLKEVRHESGNMPVVDSYDNPISPEVQANERGHPILVICDTA